MAAMGVVRAVAVAAGFTFASLAVPVVAGVIQRSRAAGRASAATVGERSPLARLLRNGVSPAGGIVAALSRIPAAAGYFRDLCWLARSRGFETDERACGSLVVAIVALALPVGWALSSSWVFGVMLGVCLAGALGIASRQAHEREVEQTRESIPDVLHAMSACFKSGYSILQTFQHLAAETRGSLKAVFRRAASDLETGATVEDALERMRRESSLSEFAFVTAALEIQHQTGGSMQKVIDSACDSIEGELALRRSLRVQTAQARLSMRVVTVMPFVLMAVFSLVSPEFLSPFFSSPMGIAVFCCAMGMQAIGVLSVRRMLDVGEA